LWVLPHLRWEGEDEKVANDSHFIPANIAQPLQYVVNEFQVCGIKEDIDVPNTLSKNPKR